MFKQAPIQRKFRYEEYRDLVIRCAEQNGTTGEATPERVEATRLNAHRMKRIEKQVVIREELQQLIRIADREWQWIVLAESWCGDGAQNIPVIAKIASLNPRIDLFVVLRDENSELMDQFLTNGSRSIPKLICLEAGTHKYIGSWGPRPLPIANQVAAFKREHPFASHDEFVHQLHLWYARDKGESLQEDFLRLIPEWIKSERDQRKAHENSSA